MAKYFLAFLLLASVANSAPPAHIDTTSPSPLITTAASVGVQATTVKEEVVEDIITGFTETPNVPITTSAPVATTQHQFTTPAPVPAVPSTTLPPPPPPTKAPRLSGKEREALIAHLGNIDLRNTDKLVLSPRQRLAIAQELEYQQLGLQPFEDPTPWQRLSRQEQTLFNEKFNSLPVDVKEFAKRQFTGISEERQEHAFEMFLALDLETLVAVIRKELVREKEALQAQEEERRRQQVVRQRQEEARRQFELEQQRRKLQEIPRSQNGNRFNSIQQQQFQQPQQAAPQFRQPQQAAPQFRPQQRQPINFDPRRTQSQQFQQPQQSIPQQQFTQQQLSPQQQQQFQSQFQQFQPQQHVQRQQNFQQQQNFQPQQQQFQQQGFQQQNQFSQRQQPARQPTQADLRHFARAEAQIQEAVALQACLANPTGPGCQ